MPLKFTFKTKLSSNNDEWSMSNSAISEESILNKVKNTFEEGKLLVAEHWYYRGSRSPNRLVFDDYNAFEDYLKTNAYAGDSIHVFDITESLLDGKQFVYGKCPNESGETPTKGAY